MLVLSAKPGEAIVVGEGENQIRVVNHGSRRIKLGFEANSDVPIKREKILNRIVDRVLSSSRVAS